MRPAAGSARAGGSARTGGSARRWPGASRAVPHRERVLERLLDRVDRQVEAVRQELGEIVSMLVGAMAPPELAEGALQLGGRHVERLRQISQGLHVRPAAEAVRARVAQGALEPVGADAQLRGEVAQELARVMPVRPPHLLERRLDVADVEAELVGQALGERREVVLAQLVERRLDLRRRLAERLGQRRGELVPALALVPRVEVAERVAELLLGDPERLREIAERRARRWAEGPPVPAIARVRATASAGGGVASA